MEWMRAALLKVQRSPFHEHGRNLGAWPLSVQKDEMWSPLWWCIAPPYRHVTIDDWQSVALVNALPLCGKHWPFIQVQRSLWILGLKDDVSNVNEIGRRNSKFLDNILRSLLTRIKSGCFTILARTCVFFLQPRGSDFSATLTQWIDCEAPPWPKMVGPQNACARDALLVRLEWLPRGQPSTGCLILAAVARDRPNRLPLMIQLRGVLFE